MAPDDIPDFPFPSHNGTPPAEYAELRKTCPVSLVSTPAGDTVHLAVRADDVRAIYTDDRFSRNLRGEGAPRFVTGVDPTAGADALSGMDAPEHPRLRRLLSAAFTPRRAEDWRPLAAQTAGDFVDTLEACGTTADLMRLFAYPLPVRMICRFLGIPEDDAPQFRAWSDTLLSVSSADGDQRREAGAAFGAYVAELIGWYRDHGAEGTLLADLIAARDGGDRLSQAELVRTVVSIILAGHETTAHMIGRGVFALLRTPGAWERLCAEPALIPAVVEELLRLEVPGHGGILRLATVDITLPSGAVIPAGHAVLAPTVAANHDPELFPDPLVLDFDRDATRHMTFGAGPHFCLGASLARVELQEAFAVLTKRLPGLRLAVDPDELTWTSGMKVSGLLRLPVTW